MKKIIIVLGLLTCLFAGFNNSIFVSSKEKNNSMFIKQGISLGYDFNYIGFGVKTTSGIVYPDKFYRIYYRDIGLYSRGYWKFLLIGLSYNLRFNEISIQENKISGNGNIGADDKNGIYICLKLIEKYGNDINFIFSECEEIGGHIDKILDKIVNLNKIDGLRIIITLKSVEFYQEILNKLKVKNSNLLEVVKKPINLTNFIEEDLSMFYKKNLEYFFGHLNYFDYFRDFSQLYYPLSEAVLNYIFTQTAGNPRGIIKFLIKIFNDITSSNENIEDILKKYQ